MMYVLKKAEIANETETLKKILKAENFGKLEIETELEVAGIPITKVNIEIIRQYNNRNRKPEKAGKVTTNAGITLPRGDKNGLRTAYNAINTGTIKKVEYYKIETVNE